MSDLLGRPPARPRAEPDQARTLEMLATLFVVALAVTTLYVGREIFIPIAIAIPVSFVLSPPNSPGRVGHRIFGQRRFDPAGFRAGC